ncbi:hypothetical protein [Rummeliibacillus stabekisii]|uniref:hypothetical protein n=1 Tax=Rummeliibacillus stabekisii TaxID=241244 RepID=UPI003710C434
MVVVKELLEFSDKIGEFYIRNLEKNLKDTSSELEGNLNSYLKMKCNEDGIAINNSVHKSIIPFSFKTRVKSKDSLEEKVIRNNIKFETVDQKNVYENFDDLIGITILTNTIGFQETARKIFLSYARENEDIKMISDSNMKKQLFGNPRIEYPHLKLKYKNIPVELQIKSVFLSAFADLEHTLFYKDFDIYELKDHNKKFMHSLAPILLDLEHILHEIYTQDKAALKAGFSKTDIYKELKINKDEILNLEGADDEGKFDVYFNKAAELLSIYYLGKGSNFSGKFKIHNPISNEEIKIINLLFNNSLEFEIVNSVFENFDEFLINYLRGELINDEEYKSKVKHLNPQMECFVKGINNIMNYDELKEFGIKGNIKLKENFNDFVSVFDRFTQKFGEEIEEIEETPDILDFIYSCLIIPSLAFNSAKINEIKFKVFDDAEESESIDMGLRERIQNFIMEEWKNFE